MSKPEHLYTAKDTTRVREHLLDRQKGLDLITGKPIPKGKAALDHCHKTQYVRGVLHIHTNVMLGKIENAWARYMVWWCPVGLPEFLRGTADFLDREQPKEYIHPMFLKKLIIEFKKLKESKKDLLLSKYVEGKGVNANDRLKMFKKVLNKKDKGFEDWLKEIESFK